MLKHEQAEKRLKAFRVKDWEKTRVADLLKLPTELKVSGLALLDRTPEGKAWKDWSKRYQARNKASETLARMSAKDRQRLFAILFPKLVDYLEAGWNLLQKLPYEVDYNRKGFRAPHDPSVHKEARSNWLEGLIGALQGFDPDIEWCAIWAPYVSGGHSADQIGILLAAALDKGDATGDRVLEILKESATNSHEIGRMGRHVTRALLVCSRQEGWEFIEKLLLAAQRQEGLRQVILESIDEAHPQAFRRILRLILDHNLLRFSSVVRAVDVWFGLQWDALTPAVLKKTLEQVVTYLENPDTRDQAIANEKGENLYFALWAIAFEDAHKTLPILRKLLQDPVVERRFLATRFLGDLGLEQGREELVAVLDDADLRVALTALESITDGEKKRDLWDKLVALLARMPSKRQQADALVWPWATTTLDRRSVAGHLVDHRGKRPATDLLPFIHDLESYDRGNLIDLLAKMKKWDASTRDLLFDMVGDRDSWVREKALAALKKCEVTEADAQKIESLLNRKGSEMRQGVLSLLQKQKIDQALASADRLLVSKKAPQRLGGLELLRQLVEKKKAVDECRKRAEAFRAKHPQPGEEEELHLEAILDLHRERPTLDNALGLMDPTARTRPIEPIARQVALCSAATIECLKALDALIEKHRETPVKLRQWDDHEEETLLGNLDWNFPDPNPLRPPLEDAQKNLPLYEIWKEWHETRPARLKDADGLELMRASIWWNLDPARWKQFQKYHGKVWAGWYALLSAGQTPVKLKKPEVVGTLVQWLLRLYPPAGAADFLINALEAGFAAVPAEMRRKVVDLENWQKRNQDWRMNSPLEMVWNALVSYQRLAPEVWTEPARVRVWDLLHWRDEPYPGVARVRPDLEYLVAGFQAGKANEHDVLDHLIGPKQRHFHDLRDLTDPDSTHLKQCPALLPIVDRIRQRILEIELKRGELPTAATGPAHAVVALEGMETLFSLLRAFGKKGFSRNDWGEGRLDTLTSLIKATRPAVDDTPERFAALVKEAKLGTERLLDLAFLVPAWLNHIEYSIGWPGLKEGVWWYLAHSPGARAGINLRTTDEDEDLEFDEPQEKDRPLNPWDKILQERTALTQEERNDGAVDPAWFHRVYAPLGRKRWEALAKAAKYSSSGQGHKKAIRISEVLLGKAKKADLISDIRDRKLKESVRLFGLLPLPPGERREAELHARYKVLVEYRRYARSLSPLSREDAERTATIGLDNLALTAGYPDPMRLEWAMEAREIADLAAGPVSVTHEGVTVTLSITQDAQPELAVRRGEKPLKNVPNDLRKSRKVAQLLERRTDLKRQASRVKQSLERMMIRGDEFSGAELRELALHPLLRPLLERLVLIGEGIRGYPVASGQALENYVGKKEPVKPNEKLRIAHPYDLFAAGDWEQWQAHCFRSEKIQPFKQVFRELYVLTQQEREDSTRSHRYAGQQVNPRQAMALWGSRGWNAQDEVSRTFHEAGIVAEVSFKHHGWTGAQVEGLTLEAVTFHKVGEYKPMPLTEVPPRIFSEVMRDGDLVVSVAHVGGVDPEASASTVQMREALVRETCTLLNIHNYEVKKSHVLIDGKLGRYSVHLGSGVVHRQPGGHVCIVPVHSQQRGRLFLPFADDDPRSAEVLSKVLLLTRDQEIQDPSILEQLRS